MVIDPTQIGIYPAKTPSVWGDLLDDHLGDERHRKLPPVMTLFFQLIFWTDRGCLPTQSLILF